MICSVSYSLVNRELTQLHIIRVRRTRRHLRRGGGMVVVGDASVLHALAERPVTTCPLGDETLFRQEQLLITNHYFSFRPKYCAERFSLSCRRREGGGGVFTVCTI